MNIFLPKNASRARLRAAENARNNRMEIVKALSQGQVSRRELIKWGIFTSTGLLAPIGGLNPAVGTGQADEIPTGASPSPLFGAKPFTQPMPRFDVLPRNPMSSLIPYPQAEANTTQQVLDPAYGYPHGTTGPIEGRPPGAIWAHQQFNSHLPQVAVEVTQEGAKVNSAYNPGVTSSLNSGINARTAFPPKFHPNMPAQQPSTLWTFNGTLPPKLMLGRYGDPILFRHHNKLPIKAADNGGFGRNTISTHEHNGHHGAENDGFTGAYFYPGQFYDYHYPIVLAGLNSVNATATDIKASSPADNGGLNKIPGDWRETMSTHWFHDHMFSYTSQNVYKGNAGMFNLYSGLDRGNEGVNDGVNLRLPSGTSNSSGWGNLDYDINLMLCDKAWDKDGQLYFDIFDFDGFLGDAMTVNLVYKPYFEVERRKYRFRILNASVSRFFELALSDGSPMIQIGNDGNLLPAPVTLTQLDEQGIAERYDIVIDFSRYSVGDKVQLVNCCEHQNGKKPDKDLTVKDALSGKSADPCVGAFLEFRIVRNPAKPDQSQVPAQLIPNPDLSNIPVARERTFEFNSGGSQNGANAITAYTVGAGDKKGPWGIKTDNQGATLLADFGRVSAAPRYGTREVWTLKNGGGGWDHPIHIHFEEGQILARNGQASQVPAWEKGRKDVYRLRPGGSVTITMQFRDWGGMFMEHCHNTVHEDNAMLLRWDIDDSGSAVLRPLPTPIPNPTGVTFMDPEDTLPTAF